ncbi:alpha/beta hydrolase-fold protein [uncultured Draconibacterium sp.]|uniref:carboxylesterase family protein n=1 Tax=uncultured Draconibacterium sp. TaxID=1573823 RepID=UPI002AA6D1C2|nr:alpha/beta hydrolase-fold protein [uncultured Draconibacterium sp.]
MKKVNVLTITLLALLMVLNPEISNGQRLKAGPQDMTFFSSVDETNQPYALYIPENFDETKAYPLVVFLHGAMSNHRLGLMRVFGQGNIQGKEFVNPNRVTVTTDLEATRSYPELKSVDYIVAAPYARGTAGYEGIPEVDVYQMIDDVKSRFNIDEDRVYLTGLSMGGGGTLHLSMSRPDIWAAIAPTCAAIPTESVEQVSNLSNLPVHIFVGSLDGPEGKRELRDQLIEAGSPVVKYTEYPGIGHNSWEWSYKDGFIFDWFSQFERNLYPDEVKFTSALYKYDKAYWVTFDKLIPGESASIDAKFESENNIEIITSSLDAFSLHIEDHPQFNANEKVTLVVDGQTLAVKSAGTLSLSKSDNEWKNQRFTPELTSKQKGAEGPLFEGVASNHVYVYGTEGNPSAEELEARKQAAINAADFAAYREMMGRIMIFPRVISDKQVRQSDYETSNLILFGTKETNSIIAKYADELPLHLDADASDYSLLYIYPMNGHYLMINSGISWWDLPGESDSGMVSNLSELRERAASNTRPRIMLNSKADGLKGLKDFILYKGGSDNIVVNGYFDSEWSIPSDKTNELKNSGVITIN